MAESPAALLNLANYGVAGDSTNNVVDILG